GYAWIQYKLQKDFQTSSDAQKQIDSGPTPVVTGPGPAFYIVDEHHTLCALEYSGHTSVSVTFDVMCDKRHLSKEVFWIEMSSQNLAYLASHPHGTTNKLPEQITWQDLPETFSFTAANNVFTDDPWRSLAGYSRKV